MPEVPIEICVNVMVEPGWSRTIGMGRRTSIGWSFHCEVHDCLFAAYPWPSAAQAQAELFDHLRLVHGYVPAERSVVPA